MRIAAPSGVAPNHGTVCGSHRDVAARRERRASDGWGACVWGCVWKQRESAGEVGEADAEADAAHSVAPRARVTHSKQTSRTRSLC